MDSSADKLAQGLQRLKQAGDNNERLGLALLSIHGALEDHFRAWLAANRQFPADQRALLENRQQVNWDKLLEWMQRYGALSGDVARQIRQANRLRQEVAHGGSYSGTRSFLDGYAALVQLLCQDKYALKSSAQARAPAASERARANSRPPGASQARRPAPRSPEPARQPARPAARKPAASPAKAAKRPADAPPPWPVGVVGRFLVFVILLLIIFILLRMFGS
jgi:hypothetical protein